MFWWPSYSAIGQPTIRHLHVGGGDLEVALLGPEFAHDPGPALALVEDGARALTTVHGDFPRPHVQVIVVPVHGDSTVFFGKVVRGGGVAVHLLVNPTATAAELVGSWTATHEFQHVGLPFIRDPWMGEGFASYYTELTRTRLGHRDEATGWAKLDAAFRRGRRGGHEASLRTLSRNTNSWLAYQRVHWNGAALAFLMDVALRKRTHNRLGLDDAIRALHPHMNHPRRIPAESVLEIWDAWLGEPLFSAIAARHLDSRQFPDLTAAYAWLGVIVDGDTVTLDDSAPGAAARRAMMAPRTPGRASSRSPGP